MLSPFGRKLAWLVSPLLSIGTAQALAADPVSVAAASFKAGDTWAYDRTVERGTTGFSSERIAIQIEQVRGDTLVVGVKKDGAPGAFEDHIAGCDWSQRRMVDGEETTTSRPFNFPMAVGKTWKADFVDPNRSGLQLSAHFKITYKVTGWEDVATPAGTFRALRVEGTGSVEAKMAPSASVIVGATASPGDATTISHSQVSGAHTAYFTTFSALDYVPSVKYYVKSVEEQYNSENVRIRRSTDVLASFKAAP